ncbi:MAG: hydantoinase B/oxoprolinase family protein, partial [Planctomycetes bacterium]|nr:hydantoinase B/oxoprolinase family protein [Planctomycetota bacterium]
LSGELGRQAVAGVAAEGVSAGEIVVRRRIINLRLFGQETSVALETSGDSVGMIKKAFAKRYRDLYGHAPGDRPIEVESVRVVASTRPPSLSETPPAGLDSRPEPAGSVRAWFQGRWRAVPVFERAQLSAGAAINGPALVFEAKTACVVEVGWTGRIDGAGALVLRRQRWGPQGGVRPQPEVVRRELFANRLTTIARQMGRMLQRTALSTNVKERLDFSCAVLDPQGHLVVNAPHIPVHLGAMGLCVRALRKALAIGPSDVVVTNHPAYGGSHLPDVTVVTAVHANGRLLGYVANRAHHAEIGGSRPGSMPPGAKVLAQEGVVIRPQYLIRAGVAAYDRIEHLLRSAAYPSRAVPENLADLRAQVAANQLGVESLRRLARDHGHERVTEEMAALEDRAERLARRALQALPEGVYEACEHLDDGSAIEVRFELGHDGAVIDFATPAGVHPGNLNATPAIVHSAVIYVLRLLVGEPLPLNEGLMRAVTVRVAKGMLNPDFPDDPARAPAVGGGNVETSQRIVDALLKALGLCACSQGTMNNVVFGNDRFSYYETVGGGCGATRNCRGADAVHSHMTNTRITDIEIIEHRYPVRVRRFKIRRGSGGRGRFRGGDGVVRELEFLEPLSLSILSQHRRAGPYGLAGGGAGAPGSQRVLHPDGETLELGSIDGCEVGPGDRLILETPGGGGWG